VEVLSFLRARACERQVCNSGALFVEPFQVFVLWGTGPRISETFFAFPQQCFSQAVQH
jgi:hypothetical protein